MEQLIWVDAGNFRNCGGWVIDQQFMDLMGSSYLLAHGMGRPVAPATAVVDVPSAGCYHVWAYTYNWTSPWSMEEGPGRFQVAVNGEKLPNIVGSRGCAWEWQLLGMAELPAGENRLELIDLTGFDGRCAALCLKNGDGAPDKTPGEHLNGQHPVQAGAFNVVVCGGGIAGICAAVSAARLGSRVALVNDRPVLGGNNSAEIRVHLGGRIESGMYPQLGNLLKEFGPRAGGNAQPAERYEDWRKMAIVSGEPNITLFPNSRILAVNMDNDGKIRSVVTRHIVNGTDTEFTAPLFIDCTGDGTVGALAGADYHMGREGKDAFNEPRAPEKADKLTMGASVQWYSREDVQPTDFPEFDYGMGFTDESCEKVTMGEWTWETGMNYDQIRDFERIRDYGLLVVYANWSFLKNHLKDNAEYRNRSLEWVAYISGKRESRRLMGDFILTENDLLEYRVQPDATAATTWTVDLHYPDPQNTKHFPAREFKSVAHHAAIYPYPVPYRCLYSRNVPNLFMAGRNISVTHVALGTTRVMRTTGMLGEVAGMAAEICRRHHALPRDVYEKYLDELKSLMTIGAGQTGLPNNQHYNEGGTKGPVRP